MHNISDRKRLEAERLRAKEAAETANRTNDEFLANVSHEIRTPMNALLAMIQLELDTSLSDDQGRLRRRWCPDRENVPYARRRCHSTWR